MVFSTSLFLFYFLPLVLCIYYLLPNTTGQLLMAGASGSITTRFPVWQTDSNFLTTLVLAPARALLQVLEAIWTRPRSFFLALASYCFYGWTNPIWVVLLLLSSLIDYAAGYLLVVLESPALAGERLPAISEQRQRSRAQKIVLWTALLSNLSLLGFFKYFDFAVENLNAVAGFLGMGPEALPYLRLTLPIGISFYTFQSMSYTIDVYRGQAPVQRNLIDFLCFVSLFPHQVAGPILRYSALADQIHRRSYSWAKFACGTAFFSLGMGKKILLANPMGYVADACFDVGSLRCGDAWFGVAAYAFQIYFDFSGYSDMAIGLGMMFGFIINRNFNDPYRADSITDFWRRWHISLSTWLREYLYVPLGGNRAGPWRTYCNLMVVMLLGGLWHGASWNFLIWGAIHGGMLGIERAQGKQSFYYRLPRCLRVAFTFGITCLAWVFFRAKTLPGAAAYLAALLGQGQDTSATDLVAGVIYTPYHLAHFLACVGIVWGGVQTWNYVRNLTAWRALTCLIIFLLAILVMWTQAENPFLYFQF